MAGPPGLEPGTAVLETVVLPIKLWAQITFLPLIISP